MRAAVAAGAFAFALSACSSEPTVGDLAERAKPQLVALKTAIDASAEKVASGAIEIGAPNDPAIVYDGVAVYDSARSTSNVEFVDLKRWRKDGERPTFFVLDSYGGLPLALSYIDGPDDADDAARKGHGIDEPFTFAAQLAWIGFIDETSYVVPRPVSDDAFSPGAFEGRMTMVHLKSGKAFAVCTISVRSSDEVAYKFGAADGPEMRLTEARRYVADDLAQKVFAEIAKCLDAKGVKIAAKRA